MEQHTLFKRVSRNKYGYSIEQVEGFIDLARQQYSDSRLTLLDSAKVRQNEFDLAKAGYEIAEVDAGVDRLELKKGHRFTHRTWLLRGYSRKEVDAFCALVQQHLETGASMSVQDVRTTVFKAKRGGYAENEVDAFIDRLVEVLQLERALQPEQALA
jgi:DivIVA domain-containing protein